MIPLLRVLPLDGGDASRHALHHLLGLGLNGLGDVFRHTVDYDPVTQLDADTAGLHRPHGADLALARLIIDADYDHIAHGERALVHVLQSIPVQEYLLSQLIQLVPLGRSPGGAQIRMWHERRNRVFDWGLTVRLLYIADRSGS